jgi:hydroxymethylpyrimidine pyrophosphatase-like HAD family hydrolase
MLEHYHIGLDECMAFGDGGNDISMFKQTNYSFAMGQALESVKNEAKYITLSNDEDGIYEALMKFNVIKGV